ncbi:MAG: PocR ligand-binding domain-containing protein [Deltaproteobacteria bacterium]|nr:PocR ligand-binding domain-containing protein [Deltaproteobacteria bacterium]
MASKPTYEQLEKRVQALERSEIALKRAMESLTEHEKHAPFATEGIFSPESDVDTLKLSDIIDARAVQAMMDDFFKLTNIGIAILDSSGTILVATGWQDICTQFHRKYPETRRNCLKSDLELSKGVEPGTFRLYRCKNNMWDMATPIIVGGKRLGNLYLGQFLFEDEVPELEVFREQAKKYNFDEKEYMEAFDRVPRWKRETVNTVMSFYAKLANLISQLSYSNISSAKTLKERTRILKAFEERERLLNEMGRIAKIGGWEHDLVTLKTFWTKGIYDIIGLETLKEPPGVDEHLDFFPTEHRKTIGEAYGRTARGGAPFDLELPVNTLTGEHLWCRIQGEAVMASGKCIKMRGVFQDITEKRRMEQALARARRLESMGILAGGLAHDYNNLLSMILGNISMAKDGEGSIADFLDDAEEATLKAKDLTHQLMTLSKGSGFYKKIRSVKDSLEICANEISGFSTCTCNISLDGNLWPAEHDASQLKYAIRNVLENGVEAMPKGGVLTLKAENVLVQEDHKNLDLPKNSGDYIKISVSDHGVGIPKANLAKVFDPYFSTKENGSEKGMGLGLAIAHAIVKKHDGHIVIHSKRGSGTTVQLYLPAKGAEDPAHFADHSLAEKASTQMNPFSKEENRPAADARGGKRVLVMDDEEMLRQLAVQMLKRLGYEAVAVKDGNEAILQYESAMKSGDSFDAVILDLTVKGGMGGREAVKALLRMDPNVRAIVSSGYHNDPALKAYEDFGFCGAMPKPYQKDDLERVLSRVLNP